MEIPDYENIRIIYPNDDGGVSILIPSPNCQLSLEELVTKDIPEGKPYQVVDISEIPSDREYRNAWKYVG